KTRDERMASMDQLLQTYLDYSPGCTFANGWCQAPEARYRDQKNLLGCGSMPVGDGSGAMAGWSSIALLAFFGRRQRGLRRGVFGAGGFVIAVLVMGAGGALAGSDVGTEPASSPEPTATSTTTITPAKAATGAVLAIPATITITTTTTTPLEPNTHAAPAPTIVP